jgi:CubicO group peptidase (beta-lactamase class C family)
MSAILCGLLSVGYTLTHASEVQTADRAGLERLVDRSALDAMASQHLAGMAVAVVDRSGPLLIKGYGLAGNGARVDAGTLFRVGSISKTMTWIAIMQLLEQGKLRLDDPINAHLPARLRVPDEGFHQSIRVRDLMGHTAGFEDAMLGVNITLDVDRVRALSDYLEHYRPHRVREPGQIAVYCNYCALLAGAIVEHETGMSFVDYVDRLILRPLEMPTATFRDPYPAAFMQKGMPEPLPAATAAKVSSGFRYTGRGFQQEPWEFALQISPAAGMSASAQDMAVYMHALLVPEAFEHAGVLRAATVLSMREPLFRNHAALGANRHGFWSQRVPTGAMAFGHEGGMAFQHSFFLVDPADGLGVFVAENTDSADVGSGAVWQSLPSLIIRQLAGRAPVVRRTESAGATDVAGCYQMLRRAYFRTEGALGELAVQCVSVAPDGDVVMGGRTAVRYEPVGNGVYETADGSDEIAFGSFAGKPFLFDFQSALPSQKIRFLKTPQWLGLTALAAMLIALWRVLAGIVRLARGRECLPLRVIDGACLLWIAAAGLLVYSVQPWTAGVMQVVLDYPGRLFPAACWMLLVASLATVLALVLVVLVIRFPGGWRWPLRLDAAVSLTVLLTFALTLASFGLLGFSGW